MKEMQMLPLSLSKKCSTCGFETNEPEKYFRKWKYGKDGLKKQCSKCMKKVQTTYLNTEHGFMLNLFNSIRKKIRNSRYKDVLDKDKEKHKCYLTEAEFFELWEKHKKIRDYRCHLSNIKMICKKAPNLKNFLGFSNGVSVDRLNPNIGYTKDNIIFVANEVNKNKGAVTKELCIKILEIYKEKGL
jgi:hypothetical protein